MRRALRLGSRSRWDGCSGRRPRDDPSNTFRIDPGAGVARIRVASGSSVVRAAGIGTLVGGLVIAGSGAALYGYGRLEEHRTMVTLGTVALTVGAVAVIGALPLLSSGSTSVKDARGHTIALRELDLRF